MAADDAQGAAAQPDEDFVVSLLLQASQGGDGSGAPANGEAGDDASLIHRLQEELDEVERQLQDIERGELFVDEGAPRRRRRKKRVPPAQVSRDPTEPLVLSRDYSGVPTGSLPGRRKRAAGRGGKRPATTTPGGRRGPRSPSRPVTHSPTRAAASGFAETPPGAGSPAPAAGSLAPADSPAPAAAPAPAPAPAAAAESQDQAEDPPRPARLSPLKTAGKGTTPRPGAGGAHPPTPAGGVAGYSTRRDVDSAWLERAQALDKAAVTARCRQALFREAAKEVGVDLGELAFKTQEDFAFTTESFLPKRLPVEVAQRRFNHYERRRVRYLAMVLEQVEKMGPDFVPGGYDAKEMLHMVDSAVVTEDAKMRRIAMTRERNQHVLDRENEMLLQRRAKFDERRRAMEKREAQLAELRRREAAMAAKRQAERQAEIDRVKSERDRLDRERREAADKKLRDEQAKRDAQRDERARLEAQKLAVKRQREAHRAKVRADFKALQNQKVNTLVSRMDQKADHISNIRRRRANELANRKEDARLRQQERLDNVNRIRRQQEHEKAKMLQKIENMTLRLKQKRELQEALLDRRRLERKNALIAKHEQEQKNVELERNQLPGPGHYEVPTTLTGGFTIGTENPKTDIEWSIYRASRIPGPGEYSGDVLAYKSTTPAATFAAGRVMSDLERRIERAADTPGPLEYHPGTVFVSDTPAFSMGNFNPMSDLELRIKRASETPGPGDYYEGTPKGKKTISQLRRTVVDPTLDFDKARPRE